MKSVSDRPSETRLIHARLVADGVRVQSAPGALLLRHRKVIAAGTPESIGVPFGVTVEHMPNHALLPALVNAHTHLDLTACGPQPYSGDFDQWLDQIRRARQEMSPPQLEESVRQGVKALVRGGVAAVGDIASQASLQACLSQLVQESVRGVVFGEVFGMGPGRDQALRGVADLACMAPRWARSFPVGPGVGIQPHAPYSSHRQVYLAALRSGLPVSTHLAESPQELEFVRQGTGRFQRLLQGLGLWDPTEQDPARHPVDWLAQWLSQVPSAEILCAHCNYVDDAALDVLVDGGICVAYCPRASRYFGHADHRYRQMLAAGVPVALGTDSMVCLDTPDRLSTLDELRLLMRRDGLPLTQALAMATVNGARALGVSPSAFEFGSVNPQGRETHAHPRSGEEFQEIAGVIGVPLGEDPGAPEHALPHAAHALALSASAPEWVLPCKSSVAGSQPA